MVDGGQVVLCSRGVRLDKAGADRAQAWRARCGPVTLSSLYGPLGAGKTTFVRAVARALEVTDPVRSPSFTIANIYSGRIAVQHLDLYRLEEIGEDDALALEEYVGPDAVDAGGVAEAGVERLGRPHVDCASRARVAARALD